MFLIMLLKTWTTLRILPEFSVTEWTGGLAAGFIWTTGRLAGGKPRKAERYGRAGG